MKERLEQWAARQEERPLVVILILALSYLAMIFIPIQRRLWHDELFTYYMAQAPDLRTLLQEIRGIDLNPPLVYLVTRGWMALAGPNETIARIPLAVAFFLAAMGFYSFLRRRIGAWWAASGIVLFWCTFYFQYATELRPYALQLLFFSVTLVSWDRASAGVRRGLALTGIILGATCLLLCHVLAIFPLGAIYLAEIGRQWQKRSFDWVIWICLLLPLATVLTYFPLVQRVQGSSYPASFVASPNHILVFWLATFLQMMLPFAVSLLVTVLARSPGSRTKKVAERIPLGDLGLAIGLLSIPFLIIFLMSRTHTAFFVRYALTTAASLSVFAVLGLRRLAASGRWVGMCVLAVLILFGLWINLYKEAANAKVLAASPDITTVKPDLPFVAASGLAFLQIDHYENAAFLRRFYYLNDTDAALRFAHATIFEGFPTLKHYFPIRANVEPYREFIGQHSHFLVMGDIDYPEEWLLRKLKYDGAVLTPVSPYVTRYLGTIYEIQLPQR